MSDYAKQEVRSFIASTRPRRTLKRLWARISIAWITFDLWYSELQVSTMVADMSREAEKQADLRRALARHQREVA